MTFRTYPPPPPASESGSSLPANTLIRAPFCAFSIVMFETYMSETMSVSRAYCPSEPIEMPCEPLQYMFSTVMCVELGLNDTLRSAHQVARMRLITHQSSPLTTCESWMYTLSERYMSQPSELAASAEALDDTARILMFEYSTLDDWYTKLR